MLEPVYDFLFLYFNMMLKERNRMVEIGKQIRDSRQEKNLTQQALSEK